MKTTLLLLAGSYLVYYIYFAFSCLLSLYLEARELRRILQAQELMAPVSAELTGPDFHHHFWGVYLPATKWGRVFASLCQPVRLLT